MCLKYTDKRFLEGNVIKQAIVIVSKEGNCGVGCTGRQKISSLFSPTCACEFFTWHIH